MRNNLTLDITSPQSKITSWWKLLFQVYTEKDLPDSCKNARSCSEEGNEGLDKDSPDN